MAYQAVILDLDGVITRTAQLHARAWEKMFNDFLRQWFEEHPPQSAFEIESDYYEYVDGKPRYDGVKSFLDSRGIQLPYGNSEDPPDRQTICGLGNRKNELFLELLDREGVEVYTATVEQVQQWRSPHTQPVLKTAVVSSSRNCRRILEATGLMHLFDTVVDGVDSAKLGLAGKPAPDIFLEAAKRLGVEPAEAIAIEDAISGIQAGKAGHFGLVVGVARHPEQKKALLDYGADQVVADLGALHLNLRSPSPNALEQMEEIVAQLGDRLPALFTDYDGTLTPIVDDPAAAILSNEMRSYLQNLAEHCTVAVISGRDLKDVQNMVGLNNLYYAGSHGFDIAGPNGLQMQQPDARNSLPDLDHAETQLREQITDLPGVVIERKKFAIAVHYRQSNVPVPKIETVVDAAQKNTPSLRKKAGKKIFELQPDVDWNKGKAIGWLMEKLSLNASQVMPFYLGDDTTDEDGFAFLGDRGISIRVGEPETTTQATYLLPAPTAVAQFFQKLLTHLSSASFN
jgi:alpha,alpha-trehalase